MASKVQPSSDNVIFPLSPNLPRLSTDSERALKITFRDPSFEELSELREVLTQLAQLFKKSIPAPSSPALQILSSPLTELQRNEIDKALIPTYSTLLEESEKPREEMLFQESGEPLAHLPLLLSEAQVCFSLTSATFHEACGEWAGKPKIFWIRTTIAKKVAALAKALNSIDLSMRLEDGFRPLEVQKGLYQRRIASIRAAYPHLADEEIKKEARAKTACAPYRAAHMSGAALDLTLCSLEGTPLPLGNSYPSGGASAMLCFPYVTWEEYRTRQIFLNASLLAGLFPYLGEDWHISYGDGLAGLWTKSRIIPFSPLRSFDFLTGKPFPLENEIVRQEFT